MLAFLMERQHIKTLLISFEQIYSNTVPYGKDLDKSIDFLSESAFCVIYATKGAA